VLMVEERPLHGPLADRVGGNGWVDDTREER
jgi:hypothetical protein